MPSIAIIRTLQSAPAHAAEGQPLESRTMQRRQARVLQFMLFALLATATVACKADSHQNAPIAPEVLGEGLCRVYVARSHQFWGAVREVDIVDRGTVIGVLGRDGYLCWDREPGQNPIQVFYHGAVLDDGVEEGILHFDGKAGGVYFYAVHLRKNDRKPEIELLSVAAGVDLISARTRAEAP